MRGEPPVSFNLACAYPLRVGMPAMPGGHGARLAELHALQAKVGEGVTQKRVTAVPDARIGLPLRSQDRGRFQAVVAAEGRRAFDEALGGALGLPPPETPPPARSKADRQ